MGNKKRIHIWGRFPLDNCDTSEIIKKLARWAGNRKGRKTVYYANVHQLRLFDENQKYRTAVKRADLVYPDGLGATLAGSLCGYKMNGRSTANDFYANVFRKWNRNKVRIFLLGGGERTLKLATKKLRQEFPGLKLVGEYHGYFGSSTEALKKICKCQPAVLLVGMGSPRQEIWIEENKDRLVGVGLIWAVGGLFNYWSGDWVRAPKPLLVAGLEWLFRLFAEPNRMAPRYILGSINLLKQAVIYRLQNNN